jgi:hypothetical protein
MSLLIFTKSYLNINNCLLFIIVILGGISLLFFDQIPENLQGKAAIGIISIPFVIIYLFMTIRKVAKYPKIININVRNSMVYIEGKGNYSFEKIGKLIITITKSGFKLFIKSTSVNYS